MWMKNKKIRRFYDSIQAHLYLNGYNVMCLKEFIVD